MQELLPGFREGTHLTLVSHLQTAQQMRAAEHVPPHSTTSAPSFTPCPALPCPAPPSPLLLLCPPSPGPCSLAP